MDSFKEHARCRFVPLLIMILAMFSSPVVLGNGLKDDPDGSVTWKAQWIWSAEDGDAGEWRCFRKSFELQSLTPKLTVRVSADSKYWLWVNGKQIVTDGNLKRGPTPKDGYYDTVDLTPHLSVGQNTIAAMVWYWKRGVKTGLNSHIDTGKAGFLLDSVEGGALKTDSTWKTKRNDGYTPREARNRKLTPETPFDFDPSKEDAGWTAPGFDDSAWAAATEKGVPPASPWGYLWRRQIPLFKDFGLKDYTNSAEIPKEGSGQVILAQLPYNAQISAYLKVDAPAGQMISIDTDNPLNAVDVRYITRAGEQEWEMPTWMSGHAVKYTIPAGVKVLSLKYRETGYDTEFAGKFESDDPAINVYVRKGVRTQYVCMRDTFMDCPDRERAQWIGDSTGHLGISLSAFGPAAYPMVRKLLMNVMEYQRGDGSITTVAPPGTHGWELPNTSLMIQSTHGAGRYYDFSGDVEYFKRASGSIRATLRPWKLPDGLPAHRGGWWEDAQDAPLDSRLYQTGWYMLTLQNALRAAELAGNTDDLREINEQKKSIEANFDKTFWNGSEYRSPGYAKTVDERGTAMAVLAGLVPAARYPEIRDLLVNGNNGSTLSEQWIVEALFRMNYAEDAITRIKRRYARMIAHPTLTTLWENWSPKQSLTQPFDTKDGTFDHAWSGSGLTMLFQYAAGIHPLEPGFKMVRVRPQMGSFKRIDATLPTLKGNIVVKLRRGEQYFAMQLTVPPEISAAEVHIPETGTGRFATVAINDTIVWRGAAEASMPKGVSFVGTRDGYHVFKVDAGEYRIVAADKDAAAVAADMGAASDPKAEAEFLAGAVAALEIAPPPARVMRKRLEGVDPVAPGVAIVVDDFKGQTDDLLASRSPDGANLPGGKWLSKGYAHATGFKIVDNAGERCARSHYMSVAGVSIADAAATKYARPSLLKITAKLRLGGIMGDDRHGRGVGLGYMDELNSDGSMDDPPSPVGFTGLLLEPDGQLRLIHAGEPTDTKVAVKEFDPQTFHTLTFTVDTTAGTLVKVAVDGNDLTPAFNQVKGVFTDDQMGFAGFYASTAKDPQKYGEVMKFSVSSGEK